jgi:hypothetical protein
MGRHLEHHGRLRNHFALLVENETSCRWDLCWVVGGENKWRNECWMVVSWSSAQGFLNARPSVPTEYKGAGPSPLQRRFDSGSVDNHREEEAEPFLYQHKKGRHLSGEKGGVRSDWSQSTSANDRRPGGGFLLLSVRTLNIGQPIRVKTTATPPLPPTSANNSPFTLFSWWLHTKR